MKEIFSFDFTVFRGKEAKQKLVVDDPRPQ